jgi:hypothetical protein
VSFYVNASDVAYITLLPVEGKVAEVKWGITETDGTAPYPKVHRRDAWVCNPYRVARKPWGSRPGGIVPVLVGVVYGNFKGCGTPPTYLYTL